MAKRIMVSGVGCCLADHLYNNISFTAEPFPAYLSKRRGDGGLIPGHLVFKEEFEQFAGQNLQSILKLIANGKLPDRINVGGPCIVALIHAAQMLENTDCEFRFYGYGGKDEDGDFLLSSLSKTPVNIDNYELSGKLTPSTVVFSDPTYDHGHGERIFINSIGAARDYSPEELNDSFFASDVTVFGGTAIVPTIHDNLTELLQKAKSKGCMTIVNTVYDFRHEKADPASKWPLGKSDESYHNIDLLISDFEEALRLSGKLTFDEAMNFFHRNGTRAVIVTNGSNNLRVFANGDGLFRKLDDLEMPISEAVSEELTT